MQNKKPVIIRIKHLRFRLFVFQWMQPVCPLDRMYEFFTAFCVLHENCYVFVKICLCFYREVSLAGSIRMIEPAEDV